MIVYKIPIGALRITHVLPSFVTRMPELACAKAEHSLSPCASLTPHECPSQESSTRSYIYGQLSVKHSNENKGYVQDEVSMSCKISKPVSRKYHRLVASQFPKARE